MEIYLDNAATTKIKDEVFEAMEPYLKENYGNASSIYSLGKISRNIVEESRDKVAEILGSKPEEIFFTSSGSEADNWAIKGRAFYMIDKNKHLITSPIEHKAVLESMKYLKKFGFKIDYVKVDKEGFVDLDHLKDLIKEDTSLVSIMYANNEIGTIEPIKKISNILKNKNIAFHVDGVQALPGIEFNLKDLDVDLFSISSHKIGGPKGIGALYKKSGMKIDNLIHGGGQERSKRAGTENVAYIVGFVKALEILDREKSKNIKRVKGMRDYFLDKLLKLNGVYLNGPIENRLPGNINISIDNIDSQFLLILLDKYTIFASSGSACNAGSIAPSHVLKAIGRSDELAKNCLRITIGENNNMNEIIQGSDIIVDTINSLRG
ncbi:cysteine desulfurase family protein [Peptoniphilus catoniae]|uniref:cysteine desulfurase family protein n=1 Tax=Peptoniphilus catoniae TaxID=1660341 RepID=UPI0010FEC1A2|nr:cysteine desulfurase family protein [Peptoniphilus catoniae]